MKRQVTEVLLAGEWVDVLQSRDLVLDRLYWAEDKTGPASWVILTDGVGGEKEVREREIAGVRVVTVGET